MKFIIAICAAVISGILLFASFIPFNHSWLIWIALVPLFQILLLQKPIYGFLLSLTCGIVFFLGMFNWGLSVAKYTFLHHAILALCWSPHFCIFGLTMSFLAKRLGKATALYTAPFIWVSLEFLRSNLFFLSFPWGLLGHSQYSNPAFIQISSITGAYGVSFLIVMINAGFSAGAYLLLSRSVLTRRYLDQPLSIRGLAAFSGTTVILTIFTLIFGHITISKPNAGSRISVAAVQPNIEQGKKWDPMYEKLIMKTLDELTMEASKADPALIVWPETATPRSITENYGLYRQVKQIAAAGRAPLLLGSAERQKYKKDDRRPDRKYLNSAFLIHSEPVKGNLQRYNKIRLLPFGEYLPFENKIPWSYIKVPKIAGYAAGNEYSVFTLPDFRFGVTICWENIFPELVRRVVKNGAQFMVNITNEAWFGRTAAADQFVAMSVFRAVENSVFVVRCGNTGISCIIDQYGRITSRLRNDSGDDLFVQGVLIGSVRLSNSATFYTKYGNVFAHISLFISACLIFLSFFKVQYK